MLIPNLLVVSTISEVFCWKQRDKHFISDEMTYVHMKKCIENVKIGILSPNYHYVDYFCQNRCLIQSARNLKSSSFLKNYMLVSQFRSWFYLRNELFFYVHACVYMSVNVHTYVCICAYVYTWSRHLHKFNVLCMKHEFWNSEAVELYNQTNVGTKKKKVCSQMHIKFISKTSRQVLTRYISSLKSCICSY